MKKVQFMNEECVGMTALSARLMENFKIFTYTATNLEYGRKQANGKFKIMTEDEIALEHLRGGKCVSYKGYVYFKADTLENSEQFKEVKKRYRNMESRMNKRLEEDYKPYLNGALYDALQNVSHFSMVKSMISLYENQVFAIEWLEIKLKEYLKPEGVAVVLYELYELEEKAG
jgi:phosphatidate phosphatase PAH1